METKKRLCLPICFFLSLLKPDCTNFRGDGVVLPEFEEPFANFEFQRGDLDHQGYQFTCPRLQELLIDGAAWIG